ncbi:zinc finger MYM-type protein 4-like [Tautogolabrus adspersus]
MRVSGADDLDEMMDIGAVDEIEQEAQMKEEEENSSMDVDNSCSASVAEDSNSVEEETDVKPTVLPSTSEEDKVQKVKKAQDSMQSSSSPSSQVTAGTGRDSSSPATVMNGMKVVKLSQPHKERLRSSSQPVPSSPSPPLVKVKDEPVDEEYEQAQMSSALSASVKDEPNTAKEDLRIGSVFSVTPAAESQSLPVINPPSALMYCSNCKKLLSKGQTAFQKKGNPALFCSTSCLTTCLPTGLGHTKICHNCQKLILRPQDVILAPDNKGAMKEFCSQICLTAFNFKKNPAPFKVFPNNQETTQPAAPPSLCSMCTRFGVSKHEVILSGSVHKLCSDACFNRFRTVNNLAMAGCANCGSYCHNKPIMLKLEDSNKTLCNLDCLTKYKQKTKITLACSMCRTPRPLVEMVDNKNRDDSVNLFCSSSCVMAYKVQTVSASGSRMNCDNCGKNTVPAYHLAMSDTSIRNFCTLPCVMAFQEKFKKSQKQVNVFTKLPIGATQIQPVEPLLPQHDVPIGSQKLNCAQCKSNITFKPEVIQIKNNTAVWTVATEEQLITMIQERPLLYHSTEKLYANGVVKTALWREIENEMNISEKELKTRWDSLRTQYCRYKRLAASGSSGAQKSGRQQWILTRLQFLEPHTKRRKTTSKLAIREHLLADSDSPSDGSSSETETSTPLEESSTPLKDPSFCEATTRTCTPLAESTICGEDSRSEPLSSTTRSATSRPPAKRSRRMLNKSVSEESANLLRTIRKALEGLASEKDPDDIALYCKNFENRLRKLPPHVLPHLQREVESCLFKYLADQSQFQDKLVFVCSMDCSHEFKKANFVTSLCEYCKIEKITRDIKRISNKDCFFCSDGCMLLFRHDLTKSWGKHCSACVYCHSTSKKLVTAQYGGSTEEFCSEECRSKYTMLFCHVAKCDTCGRKGKLKQSLPLLGEVRHYCDLTCLLQFCCDNAAKPSEVLKGGGEDTPVIANVMSLAGPPSGKSSAPERTTRSTASNSKNSGHISVQTDKVKTYPAPAQKILKNKAVLCRPLVQNKGVSCKTQTADVEAQTDDLFPRLMVVPIPVPVYIPVPMSMYSQLTPKPVGLPLPLPVPMFLPVTMDSAEQIVETIQEIKQKIPSDPYEAELILMAEMVAEDSEKNNKEEKPKAKLMGKDRARQEAPPPEDHNSNYSDDMDTEDLASFLNNWEEASSDAGLQSPSRPYANEKLNQILDIPVGMPNEPYSEPPPPASPPMDIEAEFTVETLERMARLREQSQRSPSPPPATSRRRQAHRKAREKKVRKPQRSKATEASSKKGSSNKTMAVEVPKLKSQYGVEAWKRWIQWRQTQPNVEKPRFGSRPMELKEDILRCTTAELSYGLCCFISEVKRPNGERYSPDSLFYLCLGIQQHLFQNGRVENIFMDRFYNKFSTEITNMLRGFKPIITAKGYIHSRVEEEYLWDCKQLGAYSPIVLLNTLLFFCCKFFGFTMVEQHRQLSFAHVMRCTKTNANNTKTTYLRFYPPISINDAEPDPEVPAKKRKEEENKEAVLEMIENTENPLRCPVRLYEFYLSKCSESVKQRTNLFYLHPERCCVPNSPLWFSSTTLDDSTMEAMLIRILTVRELHLKTCQEGAVKRTGKPDDEPFIPDGEEEEDSE